MLVNTERALKNVRTTLAVLLCTVVFPTQIAFGAQGQDIPGVPMQENELRSQVGAEIVDRVFSLQVAPGSVVTVTLLGEPGAELGLYIFDESATSLFTSDPIAHSARPGSRQAVSVPFIEGGALYIDVNGRNIDRPYKFTLKVLMQADLTPPFVVNVLTPARAPAGNICVRATAVDSQSGVAAVALRSSGTGSDEALIWQEYTLGSQNCFSVDQGEGLHSFELLFRNSLMLTSTPINFAVRLDNSPPLATLLTPQSDGITFAPRPSVIWRFNERVKPVGSMSELVFASDQSGKMVSGTAAFLSDRRTLIWRASARVPSGGTILVGIGAIVDAAGNQQPFSSTVVLTRLLRTSLRVALLSSAKSRATIQVAVPNALVGKTIQLQVQADIGWVDYQDVRVTSSSMKILITGDSIRKVRLHWTGDDRLYQSTSAVIAIR